MELPALSTDWTLVAHGLGVAGLCAIVAAWQFGSKKHILYLNVLAFLLFAGEQFLIGAHVGAAMMGAACLTTLAAIFSLGVVVGTALTAIPIVLMLPMMENWFDVLPLTAHATGAIAFFQKSTAGLRAWAPVGTILWAVYNVIVGAWGQFLADLFILASMAAGALRHARSLRRVAQNPEELCDGQHDHRDEK